MRTMRLSDMTLDQQRLVRALVDADKEAKLTDPRGAAEVARVVAPALERQRERRMVQSALERSKADSRE